MYVRNLYRIFIVKKCFFQELPDSTTTSQPIFMLKSASKDLPQFIEHPRNSYIVRGHSALLRCKVIHADKAYFSCNGEAMAASELHKEVDKVEISETASMEPFNVKTLTLQLNRINIEEFFGLYTCRCDAWSTKGMTSSTNATVETACKLDFLKLFSFTAEKYVISYENKFVMVLNSRVRFIKSIDVYLIILMSIRII